MFLKNKKISQIAVNIFFSAQLKREIEVGFYCRIVKITRDIKFFISEQTNKKLCRVNSDGIRSECEVDNFLFI